MAEKIVFIPNTRKSIGSGHLSRCVNYVKSSRGEASLFLIEGADYLSRDEVRAVYGDDFEILTEVPDAGLFVFDYRDSSPEIVERFRGRGLLIGLDEGQLRSSFDFLVDTLENLRDEQPANIICPEFLFLPPKRGSRASSPCKVLITFGGEDPADLTNLLIFSIQKNDFLDGATFTVVKGPFFRHEIELPDGWNLLESPKNLRDSLQDYDLVFTSYGLTAYEACAAATPFVLVNPEPYHEELSRRAGFVSLGCKSISTKKLEAFLKDYDSYADKLFASKFGSRDFISFLQSLDISRLDCPVCHSQKASIVQRYSNKNYYRCADCSTLFTQLINREISDYGEDYFFADYKKQYGKTYLEDFDHIKQLAANRIFSIKRAANRSMKKSNPSLLDVGCAYGPFLSAADEAGFEVEGIDICEAAVDYVRNNLKFPASSLDFSSDFTPKRFYDVISMWYVIEHFTDLKKVLANVYNSLNSGGVFAFSTPDLSGISATSDLRSFLQKSPDDHTVVFSKRQMKRLLRLHGFKVVEVRSTGHHPERFPFFTKNKKIDRLLNFFYGKISRVLGLGDSFELYARKIEGFYG